MNEYAGPVWRKRETTFAINLVQNPYFLRELKQIKGASAENFGNLMTKYRVPLPVQAYFRAYLDRGDYDGGNIDAPVDRSNSVLTDLIMVQYGAPTVLNFYPDHFTKEEVLQYMEENYVKLFPSYKGKKGRRAVPVAGAKRRNKIWALADSGMSRDEIVHFTNEDYSYVEKALKEHADYKPKDN